MLKHQDYEKELSHLGITDAKEKAGIVDALGVLAEITYYIYKFEIEL